MLSTPLSQFSLPRDPPPNILPPPKESPIATPLVSREVESSAISFPRRFVHEEIDILNDLKQYPIKSSFGGQNCKPKGVMSFISIVEDLFPLRYSDAHKIKAMVIFLQYKARVWFDTLKRGQKHRVLGPMSTWSTFKELFFYQFIPGNYVSKIVRIEAGSVVSHAIQVKI